jgi:predicted ester cyclase
VSIGARAEVNKAVARRLYEEVISQHRPELIEEIVAADAIDETSATAGREGFYRHLEWISETVGQVRATVTDLVAEDDRVVVFWRMEGVQRGPLFGVPPTGRPFAGQSISLIAFRDGQIVRYRVLPDRLGFIQQLGATIQPGASDDGTSQIHLSQRVRPTRRIPVGVLTGEGKPHSTCGQGQAS